MRRLLLALSTSCALVIGSLTAPGAVPGAAAANSYPTNPLGFAYNSTVGLDMYAHPGGMVVTGRCNRYSPDFATARAGGAEVLAYLDVMERPDHTVCAADDDFYGGPPGSTPLWPYPTPGQRVNYHNMHMTDMRVGSAWVDRAVAYIQNLMVENKVDGVFLDVIGARLWSTLANWDSWPTSEQQAWTAGNIDLVRRIDVIRRAINPRFIVVTNNVWDVSGTAGTTAEPYVDGIVLEHHPSTSTVHQAMAAKQYSNLGHRRVLAIANSTDDARAWAGMQGITHVSDQTDYSAVSTPPVGFHRLTDRPKTFGRTTVGASPSKGMAADQKRGSRFTLTDKATLLGFTAYLDGGGGVSGTEQVRMVLYRDSGGVPAARVAESNTVASIAAGAAGKWVNFAAPAATLTPGDYWIVIHTGATGGVARNWGGDGPANWYGNNTDVFADGPGSTFGTGTTGTGTLSVTATYTVGY
jgi:hypothetical protein